MEGRTRTTVVRTETETTVTLASRDRWEETKGWQARSPPASPIAGSSILAASRERTTKPRVSRAVQCAFLSRLEIISAVLIRLMSGSNSSLLAILSLTCFLAGRAFLPPLSPFAFLRNRHARIAIFRISFTKIRNRDTPFYRC